MPSSSSFCAMISLSSTEKLMDSPCVPSRRVVSKVKIFITAAFKTKTQARRPALRYRYPYFLFLFQERHHFAQLAADGFDLIVLRGLPHGEELLAPALVVVDPLPRELARL